MKYLILDKRQRVEVKTMGAYPTGDSRLMNELDKKNIPYDFVYNDQIEFYYSNGETYVKFNKHDIKEYSHIIFRGHNLHNPKEYELKRIIIDWVDQYNSTHQLSKILVQNSKAIKNMPYYNKIYTAQLCATYKIPYFDTYFSTDGNYTKERDILNSYPLIIKEYTGVNRVQKKLFKKVIKKNVYKIDNENGYKQKYLKNQDLTSYFIQEFASQPKDIRVFVKLGKVIGGFIREATRGFNTVDHGEYSMYNTPSDDIKEIAEKVSNVLEADFIAVDFMFKNNKPYIQEIGLHPGFKAYETKIKDGKPVNIAEAIITAFRD